MAMAFLPRSSLPLAPRSTLIGPLLASPAPNSRSSGCSGSLLVSSAFFGPLACPTSCRIAHRELSRTTGGSSSSSSLRRLSATSPRNNNLQCLHHRRRRQFMISAPLLFIIAEGSKRSSLAKAETGTNSPLMNSSNSSKTVFVAGATGGTGKRIVKELLSKGFQKTHWSLYVPMKLFVMREGSKEDDGDRDWVMKHAIDLAPDMMVGNYDASSDPDTKEQANLQWAQGKAGEDRVHVVLSEEHGWLFVGIYDGFNGPDAPDFLMSNLYTAIYQELKGLLWDQDDIGFDSFCPGGSREEKEASGAVDFPSVVGSDVEGDDEIQWQQQGSCGNNSLCQQLDSKPLDHCVAEF